MGEQARQVDQLQRVVIGMDPHKRSVTIEVMTGDESVVGGGRFDTTVEGYPAMLAYLAGWPERVWAVEGCEGIGRHVAHRLLADGQDIVDVPAKLSARTGVRHRTGPQDRRDDAHSVALVGTRMSGLRPVVSDGQLEVRQLLMGRRRSIGGVHTRKISQLHRILLETLPGGAKKYLPAAQARTILAGVHPRDEVGKTRKRVAMELVVDLERIYTCKKAADKELKVLVAATGTGLLGLHPIGPSGAARLPVEVGDLSRFPDRNHFASWTGTAPIDASSGDHVRHRLSRGRNRQTNRVLHIMATVQLRSPTKGRAYDDRKRSRREDVDGSDALRQTTPVRHRLPDHARRLHHQHDHGPHPRRSDQPGDGPERAPGQRL